MVKYNIVQNNGTTTYIGNDILQPFIVQNDQTPGVEPAVGAAYEENFAGGNNSRPFTTNNNSIFINYPNAPAEIDFSVNEIAKARKKGAKVSLHHEAKNAVKDADVIITDTWFSMGDESENNDALRQKKINLLSPFQVNEKLMKHAKKTAIFTHCLPVYRGNEATAEIVDSSRSVIFDEAENRLHIQKAILLWVSQS
jgi:aspartate carbamoyltransferase catalytic subunit